MIDKNSQEWKSVPFWIKLSMLGETSRKNALRREYSFIILGIIALIMFFFVDRAYIGFAVGFPMVAYSYAFTTRWMDKADLWGEDENK
jgi:hypothetical protein